MIIKATRMAEIRLGKQSTGSQNVVPRPGTYSTTWELGRKANSWAHPGPTESETFEMGVPQCYEQALW